jgi:hypothetical protein
MTERRLSHRETVRNLGGLTLPAGWETLADADLVHLDGAIGSGRLHRDPPPHLAPGLPGWRLSVAPPSFWTVSLSDVEQCSGVQAGRASAQRVE